MSEDWNTLTSKYKNASRNMVHSDRYEHLLSTCLTSQITACKRMRASLPSMHVIVEKGTGSNDYLFKE